MCKDSCMETLGGQTCAVSLHMSVIAAQFRLTLNWIVGFFNRNIPSYYNTRTTPLISVNKLFLKKLIHNLFIERQSTRIYTFLSLWGIINLYLFLMKGLIKCTPSWSGEWFYCPPPIIIDLGQYAELRDILNCFRSLMWNIIQNITLTVTVQCCTSESWRNFNKICGGFIIFYELTIT